MGRTYGPVGAAMAKTIFVHKYFNRDTEVNWSGIAEKEKRDLTRRAERKKIEDEEYTARKAKYGNNHYRVEVRMGIQSYYKLRMACRASCAMW